ncbi:40S ribosomal protein S5-1 [Hordeum vulgare]|nr:40S ribosomal protein S5-1 [Hordeum vulgare]
MTSPKALKDKILEKVINPYLTGVTQHPQSIEMRKGMLHIRDVEGPKKTGSMETRLEAMEQQVFKGQGMVESGLNANHMMITEFTNKHRIDANDIGKHLPRLYDKIDQLEAQIYDLQNQNCAIAMDRRLELAVRAATVENGQAALGSSLRCPSGPASAFTVPSSPSEPDPARHVDRLARSGFPILALHAPVCMHFGKLARADLCAGLAQLSLPSAFEKEKMAR